MSTHPTQCPVFTSISCELAKTARESYHRGWSPATSTNFSVRLPGEEMRIAVTRTGIDKSTCGPSDILIVDENGVPIPGCNHRPSAETPLHVALYTHSSEVGAVLHTHSLASTVLSMEASDRGRITFSNFELLKVLRGETTHETSHDLPIFPNSQDMTELGREVVFHLETVYARGKRCFGVLIEGHGLYAWGQDLAEAKRHVEAYEFLLECILLQGQRQGRIR